MNKFSDFVNSENVKNERGSSKNQGKSKEELEEMINKYSGMNQDSLMKEFLKLTLEKKKKGELSDKEIVGIKETIKPMLNDQQLESLNQIIDIIGNVK